MTPAIGGTIHAKGMKKRLKGFTSGVLPYGC